MIKRITEILDSVIMVKLRGAMGGVHLAGWRGFGAKNEEILGFEPLNEKKG